MCGGGERKEKKKDMGEKEGVDREKEEDCERLDVGGEKDEMELREKRAREEEGKGREVWIEYGKIRIDGQ